MSGGWIAGSVRARLLATERRAGLAAARELAAAASFADALALLARTPYGHEVRLDHDLAGAQRAVAETTLLNLRILAGWLPGDALGLLRALGAWYELANVEDRLAYLGGGELARPFELGSLALAWPRAAGAQSLDELRRALAASAWGDPDGASPAELGVGLRLSWARRVSGEAPGAADWAAAACALLVARELFVTGLPVELLRVPVERVLGTRWQSAGTFVRFAEALPPAAAWPLQGIESPADLWRAELAWWRQVELEAGVMLRGSAAGPRVVVAAVALLAADARRVSRALTAASRRGLPGVEEALDAAA